MINALSDVEHPCQALADYFTLQEKFGDLAGCAWPTSATATTWRTRCCLTAACLGSRITVATARRDTSPSAEIVGRRAGHRRTAPAPRIEITNDPVEAVNGADAVYTDVWASMGQESESRSSAA